MARVTYPARSGGATPLVTNADAAPCEYVPPGNYTVTEPPVSGWFNGRSRACSGRRHVRALSRVAAADSAPATAPNPNPAAKNVWIDMAEAAMIAAELGEKRDEVLRIIAARIRQIGPERVLYGTDGPALLGHMAPKEAWAQFRSIVPLTAEEFAIIENNVAPYMK